MEPVIGLDFGTTNSAIAVADSDRQATLATFADGSSTITNFRSILYFPARDRSSPQKAETQAGPEAINSYLDADTKGRLIVSIKSYLASPLFTSTSINGRNYTLEDLIAIILRRLRTTAMEQFGTSASQVVLGRPVRFSGAEDEAGEQLALQRLTTAAELAGFKQVSFELEPVAAAYQYETQLDHDELVLIGDFGGGTSDFTLARLGPGRKKAGHSPVLGTSGVAIAGVVTVNLAYWPGQLLLPAGSVSGQAAALSFTASCLASSAAARSLVMPSLRWRRCAPSGLR